MNTYKVVVKPDIRLAAGGFVALSEEAIVEALTGVVVHELTQTHWGLYVADLELRRATHEQALSEISSVVERLGCSFVEATVREWVTEALEKAVIGGGGSFVVGGGISEDPLIGLILSIPGTIVGAWVGSQTRKLKAEYQAQRDYRGAWVLLEIPQPQPAAPGLQPGFSPA